MSEAYIDHAQKCDVIFSAQRDIALQLPDVTDRDIQDIKYTGSGATMQAVAKAKVCVKVSLIVIFCRCNPFLGFYVLYSGNEFDARGLKQCFIIQLSHPAVLFECL